MVTVTRGGAASPKIPGLFDSLARHFEYEMVRLGASQEDLDYVHYALHDPQAAKLSWMGGSGRTLSSEEQEHQFQLFTEALRKWVTDRIADRQANERQQRPNRRAPKATDPN